MLQVLRELWNRVLGRETSGLAFVAPPALVSEAERPRSAPVPPAGIPRFLLAVDDAGAYLVVAKQRVVLGHARAGIADLPFLADVGSAHAELVRHDTLTGGPGWEIAAHGAEEVSIDGRAIGAERVRLAPGARVRLGANLEFRYDLPDPSSSSALLELLRGAECAGARAIVLLGEGEGGRMRIGAAAERHVRVPNLEPEIELMKLGARLFVRCNVVLRSSVGTEKEGFSIPCPPAQRFDLTFGTNRGSRPPFGLSIVPVDVFQDPTRERSDPHG